VLEAAKRKKTPTNKLRKKQHEEEKKIVARIESHIEA